MIMFGYVLLLASLLFSVSALPLASRDVVDPPITNPTAGTTWYVGQTQTVTWNATGLPENQSNPVGMLVLGYQYNNSENLMLDSPLATNINYSTGQAQITVPNVPTRTDYIVVLFGDSGNASPEFTIINGASSSTSVTPTPVTTAASSSLNSVAGSATIGISLINGPATIGISPLNGPLSTVAGQTTTAPSSQPTNQPTTSHTSTVVTVTASSTGSQAQSNAAWQKHAPGLRSCLCISLALIYFTFS